MTTTVTDPPVLACARGIRGLLAEVAHAQPLYLDVAAKKATLVELAAAEASLTELRLRVLAVANDVAEDTAARDAAAWFAHAVHADPQTARADAHLAAALETRPLVAAGMREGRVSIAQARAIIDGIADLPERLGPDLATRAEATLVDYADHHRPSDLRRLAKRILDVVAPEIAEAEDARRLEAAEQRAHDRAALRFRRDPDGGTRISGVLPDPVAQRLVAYLDAYTSPRHHHDTVAGEADRIPHHRKRAHAFAALLEHLDPDQLPDHGGRATTVLVTMTLQQLRTDLATAGLLTSDDVISASEARRLACTAGIIPVVLGGESEILDFGRSRRLFSAGQRRVAQLTDTVCGADGCTIPAAWTEAHHDRPWAAGGATDLRDLRHYCSHHHHCIHDPRYDHAVLPNGKVRFHRRP